MDTSNLGAPRRETAEKIADDIATEEMRALEFMVGQVRGVWALPVGSPEREGAALDYLDDLASHLRRFIRREEEVQNSDAACDRIMMCIGVQLGLDRGNDETLKTTGSITRLEDKLARYANGLAERAREAGFRSENDVDTYRHRFLSEQQLYSRALYNYVGFWSRLRRADLDRRVEGDGRSYLDLFSEA